MHLVDDEDDIRELLDLKLPKGVETGTQMRLSGKGDVRGVIAVEASNNAREGGALVPTLFFGIPSSGSMAVFLGGMTLLGIEAGPQLVGSRLDLTYAIIWSLAIANVMGTLLCVTLAEPILAAFG